MDRMPLIASRVLAALAFAVAMAFSAAAFAAMPSDGGTDYRLGTNDKIKVTVYDEADLSGEFQVDATGFVRFPLIGQIRAGGLTAHDVERSVAAALSQGYLNDPHVSVEVSTYRPFYVVGEVLKPGEYPYANGMTAASAVALAGGYSPKAVKSTLYVRHQGETREEQVAANDAVPILPGDVVRIDSTTFWDVMDVLGPLAGVSALRYTVQ